MEHMATNDRRMAAIAEILRYQNDIGVESRLQSVGVDRFGEPTAPTTSEAASSTAPKESSGNRSVKIQNTGGAIERASSAAAQATSIKDLEKAVCDFDGCPLKETALNTVFADGVAGANVMLVGEAPGSNEDRVGKPFVGVSGQLLDTMLGHIGLIREENFYITNCVFWRPPGNRKPNPAEVAACLPFTKKHIALVRPKILVLVGGLAVQTLIDSSLKITRARGQWFDYLLDDGSTIPAIPLLHPAYLLRTPLSKRETWRDLLALKTRLLMQDN